MIGVSIRALVVNVVVACAMTNGAHGAEANPPPEFYDFTDPKDITGYWVAYVTEDWAWRMRTPPKGDFTSVPLNSEGRKVLDQWDESQDGNCRAYGAAGLMRMPTRLHIDWESDYVLKIEADAGMQVRRLHFDPLNAPKDTPRSLQGASLGQWEDPVGNVMKGGKVVERPVPPRPGARPSMGAVTMKSVTRNLTAGWLRRNGVPYSEETGLTEYFDRFDTPNGEQWLTVTSIVNDPTYLSGTYITTSHFRRELNGSKWSPRACSTG